VGSEKHAITVNTADWSKTRKGAVRKKQLGKKQSGRAASARRSRAQKPKKPEERKKGPLPNGRITEAQRLGGGQHDGGQGRSVKKKRSASKDAGKGGATLERKRSQLHQRKGNAEHRTKAATRRVPL